MYEGVGKIAHPDLLNMQIVNNLDSTNFLPLFLETVQWYAKQHFSYRSVNKNLYKSVA